MSKITDATFEGKSGSYGFEVYPSNTNFKDIGAVYIFTKRNVDSTGKGSHELLYVGQTEALGQRISSHEKWPCVQRYGVNCICVHVDDNESSRLKKESDLLAANNTPCND